MQHQLRAALIIVVIMSAPILLIVVIGARVTGYTSQALFVGGIGVLLLAGTGAAMIIPLIRNQRRLLRKVAALDKAEAKFDGSMDNQNSDDRPAGQTLTSPN